MCGGTNGPNQDLGAEYRTSAVATGWYIGGTVQSILGKGTFREIPVPVLRQEHFDPVWHGPIDTALEDTSKAVSTGPDILLQFT
jgi:hypothetical protein